jgi:hypothetical protein
MVTINVLSKIYTFRGEVNEIEKKYQYWEDKDWEKNLMKRFVVDIVAEESSELDNVNKIEISYTTEE